MEKPHIIDFNTDNLYGLIGKLVQVGTCIGYVCDILEKKRILVIEKTTRHHRCRRNLTYIPIIKSKISK